MSEKEQAWDGKERREENAPEGLTALYQATRSAEREMAVRHLYKKHEDPKDNHVRKEDFANPGLRRKVEALLEIATSETEPSAPAEPDQSPNPDVSVEESAPQPKEKRELSPEEAERTLQELLTRSKEEKYKNLCPTIDWARAEKALRATPEALWTVHQAEEHEPVIYYADEKGFEIGSNLCIESPQSTRNCVGHQQAAEWMAEHYPGAEFNSDAETQAGNMGWGLMREEQAEHFMKNTPPYKERGIRYYHTPDDIKAIDYPKGPGSALYGRRAGNAMRVFQGDAYYRYAYMGWGGSLRVDYVA